MRQIAQNYKTGEVKLVEVPVPACRPGGVVVRSEFSLVSAGTELMKVAEGKMSLLGKARARPDQVRRVLESVSQQGVGATYRKVMNRLDSYTPLGYSLSGIVVESMVPELPVGSRVACGGNEYALHAEFNYVPKNLCALVPDGVKSEHAAFTTVGAIAMQAFRRSEATIGETVCVIGLGLIGQLLVQIAHAAGVNVFGLDPSDERCSLAERSGARAAGDPSGPSASRVMERLMEVTDGHGADVVFLAAATSSDQPVNMAVEIARGNERSLRSSESRAISNPLSPTTADSEPSEVAGIWIFSLPVDDGLVLITQRSRVLNPSPATKFLIGRVNSPAVLFRDRRGGSGGGI